MTIGAKKFKENYLLNHRFKVTYLYLIFRRKGFQWLNGQKSEN